MEKVVTVNLNGNSYQFDETAYEALRAYLDRAGAALKDNPDRAEIMRDLEQAIADKSASYLSAHKSVVSAQEIETILSEMGPVQGAEESEEKAETDEREARPRKRLYRIRDGALIAGVCSGLGAYFDIDRNLVRVLFVIATFMSSGVAIPVYIVMMFIVPSAHTSEEWASAHGVPFNAQEVIDRAKREAAKLADDPPWRRRRRWRERHWPPYWTPYWTHAPPTAATPPAGPASYLMRVLAGLFVVIFSLIGAALTIAFIVALISLASTGAVIGWTPPASVPIWLAIIVLTIVYAALAAPFAALRHASHAALTGVPYRHDHGGVFTLLLFMLVIWLVYQNVPEAHAWMDQLWTHFRVWVQQTFPALRIERAS
jgi:phage shock protein PspC (stress-responsive transcriptional regulator)